MDNFGSKPKEILFPVGMRSSLPFRAFAVVVFGLLLAHGSRAAGLADPVKRTLLVHNNPEYPVMAKQMHLEGAVVLQITIEPDGHVSDARLASGIAMLGEAAKAAVKTWRYDASPEPTTSFVRVLFSLH